MILLMTSLLAIISILLLNILSLVVMMMILLYFRFHQRKQHDFLRTFECDSFPRHTVLVWTYALTTLLIAVGSLFLFFFFFPLL